jgi:hypothetical protein
MPLDVVRLLALAMALWDGALELFCIWKYDRLPRARLYQAVVDAFSHWGGPRVLALHYILARRLLKRPDYGLRRRRLEMVGNGINAIAMNRQDDEMMLALRLLGDGQAKDLVHVAPQDGKLDGPVGPNRPHAAVFLIDQFESKFFALRDGKADPGVRSPCLDCRAGETGRGGVSIWSTTALGEFPLLRCRFFRGLR